MKDSRALAIQALLRQRPTWAHRIIMAGIRGSDAHGTKLPPGHPKHTDDVDTFGVCVQNPDWYLSLNGYSNPRNRMSWDTAGESYDHLIHDVRKLFHLLCKGNPNVHCWLWANPEDIVLATDAGKLIQEYRRAFLSRRCFAALAGYARAQLHKMDRKQFQGYMGKRRKELVRELGYDVKHAAHCIRLLNMGLQLARTGEMSTRRPPEEADMLREIKAGGCSYRQVEKIATGLWRSFQEAEKASFLPDDVDRDEINGLLVRVITMAAA